MKNAVLATLFLLSSLISTGQGGHVLYGERNLDEDQSRIFFDKNGFIYPSWIIPNDGLQECNYSLKEWSRKHEKQFISIAGKYHFQFTRYSDSNFLALNESIIRHFCQQLNESPNTSVTFLIHGFRKPFTSVNGDSDSQSDFQTLEKSFTKDNKSKSKVIEVYWDALYDCCFSTSTKKNEQLFHLFELAQTNAEATGDALKEIVAKTMKDTINIITHSLGARVAIFSLLNISPKQSPTPTNKRVNVCLIAPAIAPDLISNNYFKRTPAVSASGADNYHFYIVYNEQDFVLKKKDNKIGLFGPGPYKYGNTTLGCNYDHAATALQVKFKTDFKNSSIKLYDLSKVGKCHHVRCYCSSNYLAKPFADMSK